MGEWREVKRKSLVLLAMALSIYDHIRTVSFLVFIPSVMLSHDGWDVLFLVFDFLL